MTLIELTVAMAIGLFLIGGALYVYSQSKNTYRASDSLARLQESARFALDTLEPDIRLARYWGLNSEPALIDDGGLVGDLRRRRCRLGAGGPFCRRRGPGRRHYDLPAAPPSTMRRGTAATC